MSQSCPEMSMLTAFAAGEIAVEKGLSLAHHVDHCTSCQAKLQTIADEIKPLALSPSAITADSDQLATRLSEAKQWKRPLHRQAVDRFFVGDLEPWLKLVTTVDGKSQVAEFVLHRCLGRGGMGVVFLAEDRKLGRSVALKLMSPGLLADPTSSTRFQREAHASASINHPNVVTIHGVGVWHDLPYLVMELIEGQSLSDLMAQGPIPIRRIFEIAREMTDGLAAAHAAGVTHRDVKPQNILIQTDTGRIKLTDFGLAQTASDPALTKTGLMVGTPEFMAPEQVDPALGVVDARSDLFSLGSVIYSMCTGQPPFTGPSAISTLQAVCHTPHQSLLQSLPDVPPWFATLIDRLLEKQPADRPGSADEVSHALAMHQPPPQSFPRININSRSETQRSDRSARQTRVRPRRQQRLMIGVGCVLLVGIGFLLAKPNRFATSNKTVVPQMERTSDIGPKGLSGSPTSIREGTDLEERDDASIIACFASNTDELIDCLEESDRDLMIELAAGEYELSSVDVHGHGLVIVADDKTATRLVLIIDEQQAGISAFESQIRLENLTVEFVHGDDDTLDDGIESCVLIEYGDFSAFDCRFEHSRESDCFHFLRSDVEMTDCDVLAADSVAFRWQSDSNRSLRLINNVVISEVQLAIEDSATGDIELDGNVFLGDVTLSHLAQDSDQICRIQANDNQFLASSTFFAFHESTVSLDETQRLVWSGNANQFPLTLLTQLDDDDRLLEKIDGLLDLRQRPWFRDEESIQSETIDGEDLDSIRSQFEQSEWEVIEFLRRDRSTP